LLGQYPWEIHTCYDSDCALCNILRRDYRVSKAGSNNRYGRGIYTTPVTSKADDYASSTQTTTKCIIVNSVNLGRVQDVMDKWDNSITGPDYGYDSIHGLTKDEGGPLNYVEYVVYRDEAIKPTFVIVYD